MYQELSWGPGALRDAQPGFQERLNFFVKTSNVGVSWIATWC